MNMENQYKILHEYKNEEQYLVMNEVTGEVFLKKTLHTYDIDVFRWLSLNHDVHIPNIVEYCESDNELIVTEQFISGMTLDEYIAQKAPTEKDRIRILCELCDGLTFLHGAPKPIIHRDLKGSNILITDDGTVKIIDYDAAKTYKTGELTDTVLIGTEGSAAPEQYGFGQSDPRTDIFALGILIKKIIPDNSKLNKIAVKATNLDPANRYQSTEELKKAIQSAKNRHMMIPIALSSAGAILIMVAILMNIPGSTSDTVSVIPDEPVEQYVITSTEASTNTDPEETTESKESTEATPSEETSSLQALTPAVQNTTSSQSNTGAQSDDTPAPATEEAGESTTSQTATETSSMTYQTAYEHVYYYALESHNTPGYYLSYEGIITSCLDTSVGLPESELRTALDSIVSEYGIDFNQRAYDNAYHMIRTSGIVTDMTINVGYGEAKLRDRLSTAQFTQAEIDYACSQFDWDQEAVYYANYLTIRPHSGGPYSWDQAVSLSMEEGWFTQEQAEAAATELGFSNDLPEWIY